MYRSSRKQRVEVSILITITITIIIIVVVVVVAIDTADQKRSRMIERRAYLGYRDPS